MTNLSLSHNEEREICYFKWQTEVKLEDVDVKTNIYFLGYSLNGELIS